MLNRWSNTTGLLLLGLLLGGCGATQVKEDEPVPPLTAEQLKQIELQHQEYEGVLTTMRQGNYALAIKELVAFTERHPEHSGPYVNLGIIYHKMNRLEEAEQALSKAVAISPKSAVAQNQLGMVYRQLGRFNDALTAYKSAIAADEEFADAYLNLGILYDLYLFDGNKALQLYIRYQMMTANDDAQVSMWIAELTQRLKTSPSTVE